jgi:ribosomal protein S13
MARISGIDLPKNKRGEIGLTYIYGIGRSTAQRILLEAGIDFNKKVSEWNDDELSKIREFINNNIKKIRRNIFNPKIYFICFNFYITNTMVKNN